MTARPGGRAVKPGLERRFFAACAAASPLSFGGNKHDLAVEIKRQAGIPPRTWTPSPSVCFIQSLLEGSRFFFLPSCRRSCLCMKIASRGGTAFSLFPFRSPAQHGLSKLPAPTARRGARTGFFLFRTSTEKVRSPKFLRLRTSRAIARKGSAPLRCGCCSLKHKNPGPSELFPLQRAACLAVTGGQRGRDWRSLTNRKGKRP